MLPAATSSALLAGRLLAGWLAMSDAGYEREKVRIESAHIGVFVASVAPKPGNAKEWEWSRRPDVVSCSVIHRETQDWRDVCKAPSANGVPETFIARPGFG